MFISPCTCHEPCTLTQFPHPVNVPAFVADIREEGGAHLSKAVIPIPLQVSANTIPIVKPSATSKNGLKEPKLPILSASVAPGK